MSVNRLLSNYKISHASSEGRLDNKIKSIGSFLEFFGTRPKQNYVYCLVQVLFVFLNIKLDN